MLNLFRKKEVHLFYNLGIDKRPEKCRLLLYNGKLFCKVPVILL